MKYTYTQNPLLLIQSSSLLYNHRCVQRAHLSCVCVCYVRLIRARRCSAKYSGLYSGGKVTPTSLADGHTLHARPPGYILIWPGVCFNRSRFRIPPAGECLLCVGGRLVLWSARVGHASIINYTLHTRAGTRIPISHQYRRRVLDCRVSRMHTLQKCAKLADCLPLWWRHIFRLFSRCLSLFRSAMNTDHMQPDDGVRSQRTVRASERFFCLEIC